MVVVGATSQGRSMDIPRVQPVLDRAWRPHPIDGLMATRPFNVQSLDGQASEASAGVSNTTLLTLGA